jgi:murein DD-endopeptidase MepM/ murein hydrolase activator NlpD
MAKKFVNFLIVPEGSSRSLKFKLSFWTTRLILGVVSLLLLFVVVMSVLHGKLLYEVIAGKSLKQENEKLKRYNAKVVELEKELSQYKEFVGRVAELAGVAYGDQAQTQLAGYDTEVELDSGEVTLPMPDEQERILGTAESVSNRPDSLRCMPLGAPIEGWITQGFNMETPDFSTAHPGVDFAAKTGTEVKVTADGTVVLAAWDEIYGNLVAVDHGNGFVTFYGHNSENLVKLGDKVIRGQVIALSGNTGRSSAPHLHYEIRKDDVPVNPQDYLSAK